jgi:hypothetical protein
VKIQSKPKFTVEQYPLVFSFDASVQDSPHITVEMLYGEDPDKDLIVGLVTVYNNLVIVVIRGGIAGCIYSISCEADEQVISTTVAVLPTLAPYQDAAILPFTALHTTPPYPAFFEDFGLVGFSVTSGTLNTLVIPADMQDDLAEVGFTPVSGFIWTPDPPVLDPDETDVGFIPVSGSLITSPNSDFGPDEVDVVFMPTNGTIGPAPLGLTEDFVDFGFGPIGGSISAP